MRCSSRFAECSGTIIGVDVTPATRGVARIRRGVIMTIRSIARRIGLLSALFAWSMAFAAAPGKPAGTTASIVLRGDHATTRIYETLAKAFEKAGDGRVTVQPFSTISGLDAVHAGTADIAASARAAMPGRAEEEGTNFYPVAWDALVPIVDAANPVNNITLKQLHDVYLGRITNWKDLGGNDAPINLDGVAAPLDGVEYSTRQLLFHYGDQNVSVSRMYVNTEKLEEDIALNMNGLGMSTWSGVANNPKVKMLSVEGVRASTASISDGTYPLYSPIYLAARDDDPQHEEVAKFIAFAGSDGGKAILRQQGLVPYADAPDLTTTKQAARIAFVAAHLKPMLMMAGRPVSAPNATVEYLTRTAPIAPETQKVRVEAARLKAAKQTKAVVPKDDGGH
jgi:phosphate transport system substrate-binding protein